MAAIVSLLESNCVGRRREYVYKIVANGSSTANVNTKCSRIDDVQVMNQAGATRLITTLFLPGSNVIVAGSMTTNGTYRLLVTGS